jgi:hypothetical protein
MKDAHTELDIAVGRAFGFDAKDDPLKSLLALNQRVSETEIKGEPVQPPGLPTWVNDRDSYVTTDRVKA